MRPTILLVALLFASGAYGKEQRSNETGILQRMESVECGTDQKSGKSFAGEMLGTDSAHQKTRVLLCQEYVLQTDRIIYRIRPKDEKHPALLPVGQKAQFHLHKDKMKLRVEDMDDKEREYIVVSMTAHDPRTERGPTHNERADQALGFTGQIEAVKPIRPEAPRH